MREILTPLLLPLCEQWNERGELLVDTPLLEERDKVVLYLLVESGELRSNVKAPSLPVCLGGELSCHECILEEGDVLDFKSGRVGLCVNGQSTCFFWL